MDHVRPSHRPRPLRALALLGAAVLLAACESIPAPGAAITAQVMEVPRSRAELRGGHSHLYAALRAGVTRADAERGRLALGQCGMPDARGGVRWRVATTVLPEGFAAARGTVVEIEVAEAAPAGDTRRHGTFVATLPASDPAQGVPSATGDSLRPLCRLPGMPEGRWRLQLSGSVAAWEIDFAGPELARRDRFADAELAVGRVVLVGCQLKVLDGSDWNRPTWLARAPANVALGVGDVVRVRAGASEMGKAVEPIADVLGVEPGVKAPAGTAVVRCH